ncbi:DUF4399 domain-containing protein [Glaciimonas soli]|uniref:DUF4399 domain-containing protein n=1 Tax=Glaciimonas soli TaxID=2590999 RepID=A0A843YM17_9BURK|nr:DUF4399 domain-containing protein [Glaciimonas soli]MQQ99949.1 DUF4399 domain-containing protein [Glaciimonas soli]
MQQTPSAAMLQNPSVSFVTPADGAVVTSPFVVKFAVNGMTIKPVGDMTEGTGHHHLLIDLGPMPTGEAIPMDAQHKHYGKGQTEDTLTLAPGVHQLTLQFGDGAHRSYGPAMSKTITVTVQ